MISDITAIRSCRRIAGRCISPIGRRRDSTRSARSTLRIWPP